MLEIIDARLTEGRTAYGHYLGGVGRRGMVIDCWFGRHGRTVEQPLDEVARLFEDVRRQVCGPRRYPISADLGAAASSSHVDLEDAP